MGVSTFGTVLDVIDSFELRHSLIFDNLSKQGTSEGVRLLCNYFAKRRRHIPEALANFSEEELHVIRATPIFEDDIKSELERHFSMEPNAIDIEADILLQHSIDFIQICLDCYTRISEQRIGENAISFLKSLIIIQTRYIVELKKTKNLNYFCP